MCCRELVWQMKALDMERTYNIIAARFLASTIHGKHDVPAFFEDEDDRHGNDMGIGAGTSRLRYDASHTIVPGPKADSNPYLAIVSAGAGFGNDEDGRGILETGTMERVD